MSVISGELLDVRTFGGWAKGRVLVDGVVKTVVGEALAGLQIEPGRRDQNQMRFTGEWRTHPKFGEQFEVVAVGVDVQASRDSLIKYLVRHYAGCGVRTADRIVQWYLDNGGLADLRDLLIHQPENLPYQPVMQVIKTPLVYEDDSGATGDTLVYRRLALQLGVLGISHRVLRSLASYLFGLVHDPNADPRTAHSTIEAACEALRRDCYGPIAHVEGYAWATAEQLGAHFEVPKDAPERLAAMAHHVITELCKSKGHAFLTRETFGLGVAAIDATVDFDVVIGHALARGVSIVQDGPRYYIGHLLRAERLLAERFARMCRPHFAPIYTGDVAFLDHAISVAEQEKAEDFRLDPSQRAAVKALLTSRSLLHTLTAGPGCGKTSIMEILTAVVQKVSVCFLAPTGKAAKVLSVRVAPYRREAMTIHRVLEPSMTGFQRNAGKPIDYHVAVVDESSMVDLQLMADLVDALPEDAHLVLIGDADQLPSVGPGRVLEDVLQLPADHNRLTQTHRNKGGILDLVQRVRRGEISDAKAPDVHFRGDMGEADTGFDLHVLPAYLDAMYRVGVANVTLILPRRKGKRDEPAWNVTYANARLQDCLNPEVQAQGFATRQTLIDQRGRKVPGGGQLRVGDRVMMRKNVLVPSREDDGLIVGVDADPDGEPITYEPLVNGDSGTIAEAHCKSTGALEAVVLNLDDGRTVRLPVGFVDELTLAYAGTVHSSQGSECAEVLLVMNTGHADFLHRRIVYTAVSRARDQLTIFGAPAVLQKLVERPGPDRHSMLVPRVNALHAAAAKRAAADAEAMAHPGALTRQVA